jgi:RNA polymerase sigma-70 factor (ECF subfamily)
MSNAGSRDRDRENLRRLAEGDVGALEAIWAAHGNRAFRHALWVTGRREDAEDVVQTVFVVLAGLGAELLGVRDLTPYLGAMVHREAVKISKSRALREGRVEVDAEALLAVLPDAEGDADRRRVAALVATLPSEQREVVLLHVWGGRTFREIGRAAGVSTFTVASRYRLATARLKRLMTGEGR